MRKKGRLALAGDTVIGARRSGDRRRSGGAAAGTPRGTITPSFYACCDNGAVSAGIGFGKILYPGGVVEIEMGQHDMANSRSGEPERFDLTQGGIRFAQPNAARQPEKPAEPARLRHISQSETGIDEDEGHLGFEQ